MRYLLIAITLLFSITSYSQLTEVAEVKKVTVGEVRPMGSFIAGLYYMPSELTDTTYVIMYRNIRFKTLTDIQSIKFKNVDNTVGKLYDLLNSVFDPEIMNDTKWKKNIKLGDTDIIIAPVSTGLGDTVMLFVNDDNYFYLNQRQLRKLFNVKD